MPTRNITPSSYVGPRVRHFRKRRGWRQEDLVERLHELGMEQTGWSQTKIHKLESGKMTRVLVDDVFELAAALDVSPLYLLTPMPPFDENENPLNVWIGGKISRGPREVRQWVRGVRPILDRFDYRDDEEARKGQRFYLLDSQPLSEWQLIKEAGNRASRAGRVVGSLDSLAAEEES